MRNNIIFALAVLGIIAGLVSAYIFGIEKPAQPPVFTPTSNPFTSAIYSNGMVESDQESGENISIFPEVSGPVTKVWVHEGQTVAAGTALMAIDDSVQKSATEQLRLQSESALELLLELKAQPRKETLAISKAQVVQAEAALKTALDQSDKRLASYQLDPRSISKDSVDTAQNTTLEATTALAVATKQYALTKAGAWSYDIKNQQKLADAAKQAYLASNALLAKYVIKSQAAGVVLAINASVGSYVSSSGAYDTYTQGTDPMLVLGTPQEYLAVRCFVDEILVSRIPAADHMQAQMSIRGSTQKIPLTFVRIQPLVSPKIELSNQRQEKVDLRVLPIIFRFSKKDLPLVFPGQQVDVFIGKK